MDRTSGLRTSLALWINPGCPPGRGMELFLFSFYFVNLSCLTLLPSQNSFDLQAILHLSPQRCPITCWENPEFLTIGPKTPGVSYKDPFVLWLFWSLWTGGHWLLNTRHNFGQFYQRDLWQCIWHLFLTFFQTHHVIKLSIPKDTSLACLRANVKDPFV